MTQQINNSTEKLRTFHPIHGGLIFAIVLVVLAVLALVK